MTRYTNECLGVEVDDVGVRVVSVSAESLNHERCRRLHAMQQAGMHHPSHLRLQHVLPVHTQFSSVQFI